MPSLYAAWPGAMLIYKEEGHFRRPGDVDMKTLVRDWFSLELPSFRDVVVVDSFTDLDPRDQATTN